MTEQIKIRLMIEDSPVRGKLEQALRGAGFDVDFASDASASDAGIFISEQRPLAPILEAEKTTPTVITVGELELHILNYEAFYQQQRIPLTASEFQMLRILCCHRPQVIPRRKLVELFTGLGFDLSLRTIDNHILNLRKKLGRCQNMIQTVRGVGYKIQSH